MICEKSKIETSASPIFLVEEKKEKQKHKERQKYFLNSK